MAPNKREAIAEKLHSVAIHLLRRLREADEQSGLSPARLSALSVLVFGGECTLGELAAAEQVTAPTITRLVQSLEKAGLVARSNSRSDRRSTTIRATKRGEQVLRHARAQRLARFTQLLLTATQEELKALASAASTLERLMSA